MWLISKVGVRQLVRWKECCIFNRVKYHSGLGIFGHRPRTVNENETPKDVLVRRYENSRAAALVDAYRRHGHLKASIDNVDFRNEQRIVKELNLERYGLKTGDPVDFGLLYGYNGQKAVGDLIQELELIYCGNISYEFTHLESETEREWFAQRVEGTPDPIDMDRRREIAAELLRGQAWEKFLAVKLPAVKRFSGEGAESLLTIFSTLFRLTSAENIEYVTLALPHRGKLSAMVTLLKCPPVKLFHKFSGRMEFPEETGASCDIALHFSLSSDINVNNKTVRFSMVNNPSHLEIANPVSMGKARSKQLQLLEGDYSPHESSRLGDKVFNVQFHGDAAFAGQGVNQESLMMSQAPHFDIGGSFHVVVNNQVGFTLPADRRGSSRYVTDVAKMIAAPVIHVNADYPELVAKATNIAFEYRQKFRKDVFIDYNCYRRWGHNEMDEPTFTSPLLYRLIQSRKSITDLYAEKLIHEGILKEDDVKYVIAEYTAFLQKELDASSTYKPEVSYFQDQWSKIGPAPKAVETWDTGFDTEELKMVGRVSVTYPSDFNIHTHLARTHVKNRLKKLSDEKNLDWATAEALAFGSLLLEGRHVRISGEDVGRGTFSHRHVMLVDQQNNKLHIPLNHIKEDQKAFLEV
ncbi:probable 2-oxoglutarate dehydrogenase E1 component DHKTD1 homolog, mitochondrial [Hyposmocoma kahamanoa]|uniref:probable 2-oxoglutarate dehydrogenase E1 component DHKTD1 homolog, mitochondrial n=1 Tax=Hyposmocoma kahamanoa TaxID=1477025 RepID=UPI000E6DA31F|nr:probable 2-oxoglutarate dehydrogenase E1 component DHKTD1 homolog, mitochondrial [Hyposmocoma kahamanoa]